MWEMGRTEIRFDMCAYILLSDKSAYMGMNESSASEMSYEPLSGQSQIEPETAPLVDPFSSGVKEGHLIPMYAVLCSREVMKTAL